MVLNKTEIKIYIMRYKYPVFQQIINLGRHFMKGWSRFYHGIGYASHTYYKRRNGLVMINQGFINALYFSSIMKYNRYFCDSMLTGKSICRFNIYYRKSHGCKIRFVIF